MNIVIAGSRVQVYGEDVKTFKRLPIASYDVQFNKMTGFYLTYRNDLVANEEKIYGDHERKVNKVINSFKIADRNLGIILSGQKGIGKSLFARILAQKTIEVGMPVITVAGYIPGVADFISSIEQECLVIFDEFEKTFSKHDDFDPQEEMLSLFDGMDNGKKLFCITCNEVSKLNSYLLNRPGRFHYHFQITNPSDVEIREYLTDKLKPEYQDAIDRVVNFSRTIHMTYDFLRAIVFELNQGYDLEEALGDLNITRSDDVSFDITMIMSDGKPYTVYGRKLDAFSTKSERIRMFGPKSSLIVEFTPADMIYQNSKLVIPGDKISIELDEDDYWDLEGDERTARIAQDKARRVISFTLEKRGFSTIARYCV